MRLLLRHFSAVFDDHNIPGLGQKVMHYYFNVFFFLLCYFENVLGQNTFLDINHLRWKKKCTVVKELYINFKNLETGPNFLSHMGNLWKNQEIYILVKFYDSVI